jgi:hypothetical protein
MVKEKSVYKQLKELEGTKDLKLPERKKNEIKKFIKFSMVHLYRGVMLIFLWHIYNHML